MGQYCSFKTPNLGTAFPTSQHTNDSSFISALRKKPPPPPSHDDGIVSCLLPLQTQKKPDKIEWAADGGDRWRTEKRNKIGSASVWKWGRGGKTWLRGWKDSNFFSRSSYLVVKPWDLLLAKIFLRCSFSQGQHAMAKPLFLLRNIFRSHFRSLLAELSLLASPGGRH